MMSISDLYIEDVHISAKDAHGQTRESNHRIANNLALVSALLRMQASAIGRKGEPLNAPVAARTLVEAAVRVENVGRLHRLLSGEEEDATAAGPYLADVCAGVSGSLASTDSVEFEDKSGGARLAPGRLNALALFLTEALTNAIKYAHSAGAPGHIKVRFRRSGHHLELESHDDGVGLPDGFDSARDGGLGFRIMRSLADQVGGTLAFPKRDFGHCISLCAPVAVAVHPCYTLVTCILAS